MSLIITIGRQFGSGGRDVGEKVAEYFNIPFYDKELVELAAQKSNISKEALKEVDEHATNSFLYSLASGNYSMRGINAPIYYEMPINDKLFIAQADVIKEVAKRGSCVIVGRCARTRCVCPPDTTNEKNGGSNSLCSIKLAAICPSI